MSGVLHAPGHWASEAVSVSLIGCGGTGSSMIDELFRMHALLTRLDHPGLNVTAWDGDTVSEANIGRQRFWPCDVGWNKAEILVKRYNSFGDTDWRFVDRMLTERDCRSLNSDVIITCIDRPEGRVMVGEAGYYSRKDTLWLDTGNGLDSGQVILGHWNTEKSIDDEGARIPNVLDLYPDLREQKADERDSCSAEESLARQDFGINQRVAAEASGLLWRLIRYGKTDRHGSYIYQELGEVLPLRIDEASWNAYGMIE